MSTATTGAAQAGAMIIPFPRRPVPGAAGIDAVSRAARDMKQTAPAIEWGGGWYHDAAIAAEKPIPHA